MASESPQVYVLGSTRPPEGGEPAAAPEPARAQVPFVGHLPAQQQLKILGILLAVLLALAAAVGAWVLRQTAVNGAAVAAATELQTLSQRIARTTQQVLTGSPDAAKELGESRAAFAGTLAALGGSGTARGVSLPAPGGAAAVALDAVRATWDGTAASVDAVIEAQKSLGDLSRAVGVINQRNPDLLEAAEQLVELKLQTASSSREVSAAGQLVMLTQRMAKNANALLAADVVDPESSFILQRDEQAFRRTLGALLNGSDAPRILGARDPETREKLLELDTGYRDFQDATNVIIGNLRSLVNAKRAGRAVVADSPKLLTETAALADVFQTRLAGNRWWYLLLGTLALAALTTLVFIVRAFRADSERRAAESQRAAREAERQAQVAERQNKQNQDAILRLMNEMSAVAEGDLTVQRYRDRRHHRRHRRLGELHRRGAARAGRAHQRGGRAGDRARRPRHRTPPTACSRRPRQQSREIREHRRLGAADGLAAINDVSAQRLGVGAAVARQSLVAGRVRASAVNNARSPA
jgi:twitching motility protein PilJ